MKIVNPTKNKIEVTIQGVHYTLPGSTKEKQGELKGIPEAHAEYWKVNLHQFLEVHPETNDSEITLKSAKTKETIEEEETTDEVAEESEEEEEKKEPAPKKTVAKKTTKKTN